MCRNFAVIYVTIGLDASSAFEKIVPSIVFWFFCLENWLTFYRNLCFWVKYLQIQIMYHNVNESEFFASFTLPCFWIAVPYRKVRLKM